MDSSTPNWEEMYDEDSMEADDTSIEGFNVFDNCDVFDDRDEL